MIADETGRWTKRMRIFLEPGEVDSLQSAALEGRLVLAGRLPLVKPLSLHYNPASVGTSIAYADDVLVMISELEYTALRAFGVMESYIWESPLRRYALSIGSIVKVASAEYRDYLLLKRRITG